MASWVLECPNCKSVFAHAKIDDNFANYFLALKPEFPKSGQPLDCPNCGHKATH
jgi:DNA-directed RNA polymerase subunit RPC12/RpoP